jgi:multidrug efflux pump subunit AcrA (membrane-fusion protein)
VAPNASATTHTFPVYVTVDNTSETLAGGMLVRATLNLNEKFTALAVSKDAIVRQGTSEMIYTINEGVAAPMSVRSTSSKGEFVAIEGEGLSDGMVVVVRGNERIFPGSPVRTAGDAPPGAPEAETPEVQGDAD